MRKIVVALILLLIVGGVVFYFGWIQFQIPADRVGVIFTRTSGWDQDPVEPGSFHWRWENLLPTNLTLHQFDLTPHRTTVRSSGTLPSGDLYRRYLEGDVDFSYAIELTLSFRVVPGRLPALAAEQILTPDIMPQWYGQYSDIMSKRAMELIDDYFSGMQQAESFSLGSLADKLADRLTADYPDLQIIGVIPVEIVLPDLQLYSVARQVYLDVLAARSEATAVAASRAAGDEVRLESRLAVLRRYGELLEQYPVLLEYFALSAERGVDPLNLDALRALGALP